MGLDPACAAGDGMGLQRRLGSPGPLHTPAPHKCVSLRRRPFAAARPQLGHLPGVQTWPPACGKGLGCTSRIRPWHWASCPRNRPILPTAQWGRWGWRKASSLLSAGEELIILFSHYTGIKSILEQHKFRCLKSLFLTSWETFLSLSRPFPNHFCLIAQPSMFRMKHKMEGH